VPLLFSLSHFMTSYTQRRLSLEFVDRLEDIELQLREMAYERMRMQERGEAVIVFDEQVSEFLNFYLEKLINSDMMLVY
jgi:hypothetical protein